MELSIFSEVPVYVASKLAPSNTSTVLFASGVPQVKPT